MVQHRPTFGGIFGAAGDKKGPRCHQRLELDEIMTAFDKRLVRPGTRTVRGKEREKGQVRMALT